MKLNYKWYKARLSNIESKLALILNEARDEDKLSIKTLPRDEQLNINDLLGACENSLGLIYGYLNN